MRSFPSTSFRKLYHRGDLTAWHRGVIGSGSSHEGPLLSCAISEDNLGAWEHIAGLTGTSYRLTPTIRHRFKLLNWHALTGADRRAIARLGESHGLNAHGTLYRYVLDTDENEEPRFCLTTDKSEARSDAMAGTKVQRRRGPVAAARLAQFWHHRHAPKTTVEPMAVLEAVTAWLIEHDDLPFDGIFWDDEDSPYELSAPRAGLTQRALGSARRVQTNPAQVIAA